MVGLDQGIRDAMLDPKFGVVTCGNQRAAMVKCQHLMKPLGLHAELCGCSAAPVEVIC